MNREGKEDRKMGGRAQAESAKMRRAQKEQWVWGGGGVKGVPMTEKITGDPKKKNNGRKDSQIQGEPLFTPRGGGLSGGENGVVAFPSVKKAQGCTEACSQAKKEGGYKEKLVGGREAALPKKKKEWEVTERKGFLNTKRERREKRRGGSRGRVRGGNHYNRRGFKVGAGGGSKN